MVSSVSEVKTPTSQSHATPTRFAAVTLGISASARAAVANGNRSSRRTDRSAAARHRLQTSDTARRRAVTGANEKISQSRSLGSEEIGDRGASMDEVHGPRWRRQTDLFGGPAPRASPPTEVVPSRIAAERGYRVGARLSHRVGVVQFVACLIARSSK